MKIGVDFDRVVFDTDSFKQMLKSEFPDFSETYPEGIYEPGRHAEKMGVDEQEILEALEEAERFVFDGVEELESLNHELVIVSRGDPSFQRRKIKASGVMEFFNDFYVVEEEPKDETGIDFLVDDREEEVEDVDVPGIVFDHEEDSFSEICGKILQFCETGKVKTSSC